MDKLRVDRLTVRAWLAGRSIARGLPPPIADHGGYRVDTNRPEEACRWVFADVEPGLRDLGRIIDAPGRFLKLCADADTLRSCLPDRWRIMAPGYFMTNRTLAEPCGLSADAAFARHYTLELVRDGPVVSARVHARTGEIAASGHAAETPDAFVYDQIVTGPAHRRRGLGRVVMTALRSARRQGAGPDLLVATAEGKALYAALGWTQISHFSTAEFAGAVTAADRR